MNDTWLNALQRDPAPEWAERLRVRVNYTWVNPDTGDLHMDLAIWRGNNPEEPLEFSNPVIVTNYPPVWDDAKDLIALGRQLLTDFASHF